MISSREGRRPMAAVCACAASQVPVRAMSDLRKREAADYWRVPSGNTACWRLAWKRRIRGRSEVACNHGGGASEIVAGGMNIKRREHALAVAVDPRAGPVIAHIQSVFLCCE
jgi:hypothetical protein